VSQEDIAHRAYALYLARQGEHGNDVADWLQAEKELRSEAGAAVMTWALDTASRDATNE
jgi:hypothetical protein